MTIKKLAALATAAALALCMLAGCFGGNRAMTSVLLDMLAGQYENVSFETDPELEDILRRAVRENDNEEDILAALEKALGGDTDFAGLAYVQQGEGAFDLIFYPGDDPEAAARSAYAGWASVLGRLPGDGRYSAGLAMIETENGYYILIQNTVTQPAREPQEDDEPEKPEEQEKPEAPYTDDGKGNYTVNIIEGLKEVFGENAGDFAGKIITLKAGATFTVDKLADTFKGTLTSDATNKATIEITGENLTQGLFDTIEGGTVENLKINVTADINASPSGNSVTAGAVAGTNSNGTITGCEVTIKSSISANGAIGASAGGVVGSNDNSGIVSGCSVTIESNGSIIASGGEMHNRAGGVAGNNTFTATINQCRVTIESGGSIHASGGEYGGNTGYVVGYSSYGDISVYNNFFTDHSGLNAA